MVLIPAACSARTDWSVLVDRPERVIYGWYVCPWRWKMLIKYDAALLLGRFVHGVPYMAFVEGVLIGASLAFNLAYLIRSRSKRDRS